MRALIALFLTIPTPALPTLRTDVAVTTTFMSLTETGFAHYSAEHPEFGRDGQPNPTPFVLEASDRKSLAPTMWGYGVGGLRTSLTVAIPDGHEQDLGPVSPTWSFPTGDIKASGCVINRYEPYPDMSRVVVRPFVVPGHKQVLLWVSATEATRLARLPLKPLTPFGTPVWNPSAPISSGFESPQRHTSDAQILRAGFERIVPDGGCVVMYLGHRVAREEDEQEPLIKLGQAETTNSFRMKRAPFPEHVFAITTIHIRRVSVADEYVTLYHEALREGRKDDARNYAAKALAADPACFAK